ncbi:MAG: 4-hydroxyproline epimerase, partial [Eudoraea sp.]|nr:4-hydroxyproline epimerase [Eudoraea sp.]
MSIHTFKCIDGHTCGNPVRVVTTGAPPLQGKNMSEKRAHFIKEYDWIRTGLMFEPRGHDMMSGCFFYPPNAPENDLGILFIETSGCLPMCGHGTIGAMTIGLQEGLIHPKKPGIIRLETPAGLVIVHYQMKGDKVEWVRFNNVKSYLAEQGLEVESSYLGKLSFDVAYGGNFYAIFDPQKNFKGLQAYKASELILMARELRERINIKYPDLFIHPEDSSIFGVSHVLWTGETISESANARNAVFYGKKAIDRSPCG